MARLVLSLVAVFILASCSSSRPYSVVLVPEHSADLYPLSQTRSGVTIAVDEMRSPTRVQRHFGADLGKEGILPVQVVVSNYSRKIVLVKPSDVLFYRGQEVIDALPVSTVVATGKRQHGALADGAAEQLERFFQTAVFKETVLAPGETYRGVMFFAAPPAPEKKDERFFSVTSVYLEGAPRMRVGLTDVESGERMLFGPFSMSLPGVNRASYY